MDTWDKDRLALEQALTEWGLSARKDGDSLAMNLVCLLWASLDEIAYIRYSTRDDDDDDDGDDDDDDDDDDDGAQRIADYAL